MIEPVAGGSAKRLCAWCRADLDAWTGQERATRKDARFCSQQCRQFAFRLRRRSPGAAPEDASSINRATTHPLQFAYADPPYPGMSKRFYGKEPSYAGEVDHEELIARLEARMDVGGSRARVYDGWALSTSAKALRELLPLCPPEVRVCAWVKPHGVPPATYGLHNAWEPLLVLQGRRLRPGRADRLVALPARSGGTLPGRKPIAFCAWLFECLGMLPGDELDDLFPGTGIVGQSWLEISATRRALPAPTDGLTVFPPTSGARVALESARAPSSRRAE